MNIRFNTCQKCKFPKLLNEKSGSARQDFDSKQFTQLIPLLSYIATFLEIAV